MSAPRFETDGRVNECDPFPGLKIVELALLLPAEAAAALERAARPQGLTVGQLIRRLIGDFLGRAGVGERCRRQGPNQPGVGGPSGR